MNWRSKKKTLIARSGVETTFKAMAHEISELLLLKTILKDPII